MSHPFAKRVVFAGGPGTGKTTLLLELQARGHAVAVDSARAIIQARRRQALSPRPPAREFAQAILALDIQQYDAHASRPGLVFFERGVVDALAMLDAAGALAPGELQATLATYPYERRVFLFPPWREIFVNDPERDQAFEESVEVCHAASAWYRRCGYEPVEVPKVGLAERCSFVLRTLGEPTPG